VTEQPVSSEEAPAAQETASEPPPAEQPASSEAAPPASSEAAPVSSEAAPVSSEAPPADQGNDAVAQLTAAVELYNQGVAELTAGDPNGQAKIDEATAQMNALCTPAGYPDIQTCVAQFGLTLDPLPAAGEQPPATSEQPATSEEPVVGGDQPVTNEATEVLPEDVPPEEAAPILDSEKDETAPPADDGTTEPPPADQPSSEQPPAEQPAPTEPVAPPENDQAAQQDIQPPPPEEQSAATGEGEAVGDFQFGFVEDPQQAEAEGGFVIPEDEDGEQVEVIQAPSANNPSFVFKIGIHIYITNVQRERDRFYDRDRDEIYYERLDNGRIREVITRPDGTRIITVYNRYGDVLKRTKIYPDNREFYLASFNLTDDDDGFFIDPGDELPPLRLTISAREYILDADEADEEEVEFFLSQPPVERITRIYSINEVKRSARIRDTVRRLEIGNLTFNTGEATIPRDQVGALSKVANAILKLLEANPAEVFLIEGHTDAVGSDLSNLELSDERASTVARILTDFYEVPPENLTTQGYGERYLKVETEEAEELNRRVTFKRITPLVTYETASN
jgi:outer membrane protein OmpA-like peptidoglycan-associated protein